MLFVGMCNFTRHIGFHKRIANNILNNNHNHMNDSFVLFNTSQEPQNWPLDMNQAQ